MAAQGFRLSHLDEKDRGWWQVQSTALLTCIARGEIDAVQLAHEELANRGLDLNGEWVGFEVARRIHEDLEDS